MPASLSVALMPTPARKMALDTAFPRHLLGMEGIGASTITAILDKAEIYVEKNRQLDKKLKSLSGRTLINLFFENSTRTRTSFELAGKRLGMDVINISASTSSTSKGETLLDTAMTLNAMKADAIVVRHGSAGAVQLIAEKTNAHIINAGDGAHEHPTQALLDALTIRRRLSSRRMTGSPEATPKGIPGQARDDVFKGLKIAICGDIANSRVARSNIYLLKTMGAEVTLVAPPTLMPTAVERFGVAYSTDMRKGLRESDVVMMLRIQHERMGGRGIASVRDYFHGYGLDYEKLEHAKPNALIMHPGPMNRGVEIDSDVADDIGRSAILDQVEMGVAVRQAVLELVLSGKR